MEIFYLLQKNQIILAVKVLSSTAADEVSQLQEQGFVIISDSWRGIDSQKAVNSWRETDDKKKYKELSPIDRANITIRKANIRVHELKCIINELEERIALCEYEKENLIDENFNLKNKLKYGDNLIGDLKPHEILGFEDFPNQQDLRKKYKKISLIYHPDRGGTKKMMNIINQAYTKIRA
jgi:hypothetical protein